MRVVCFECIVAGSVLDFLQGRGADRGIVGSGIGDVFLLNVGGDGLQDAQQFGTVGGTVQERGGKVSGHESFGGGCRGKFAGRTGFNEAAPAPQSIVAGQGAR